MERLVTPAGVTVSYRKSGTGPPLVLVHGSFSDHLTNWEFVTPRLDARFSLYAVARRGRGETSATGGHSLEDEALDVAAVIEAVGEPVFLLGHSYGAHCALAAAATNPDRVRELVLYEPPRPSILTPQALARLEAFGASGNWDEVALTFFRDTLLVPEHEIDGVRRSDLWPPIAADAPATLGDLRALQRYDFDPAPYRSLACPVLLQIGSESPRNLYVTDALAAALPDARIEALPGQAHEGMTTAPAMYAEAVTGFLGKTAKKVLRSAKC